MIVGTGVDVVEVRRFAEIIERRAGFLDRILTKREQYLDNASLRPVHSLAARFAAKEALAKALGAPTGLEWHHCEVLTAPTGQPYFELSESVLAAARELGAAQCHLSLSHDGGIATAFVVVEKQP